MAINLGRIRGDRVADALTLSAALTFGTLGVAPAIAAVDPNTASISGILTQNMNGTVSPVATADVYAYSVTTESYAGYSELNADGSYSIQGLSAGRYMIEFNPHGEGLAAEFYGDTTEFAAAEEVVLYVGLLRSGIDALLQQGGTITGTLTKSSGGTTVPAAGVNVYAYSTGWGWDALWAQTDVNGRYTVDGLAVGNYKLQFVPEDPGIVSKWCTTAVSYASATIIAMADRAAVTGVDAAMPVIIQPGATTTGIDAQLGDLPVSATPVERQAGADRFATSAEISKATFAPGVPVAYIANGYNFPDALSSAPVAGLDGAPVLLVPTEGIPAAIHNELKRLQPARIIVLGGPQAVSTANANLLSSYIVK